MDSETFAHVVSHDLKGPLNGIVAMLESIAEDYGDHFDQAGLDQLRLTRRLAARGVTMVEALRDYCAVARTPIEPVAIETADLIGPIAAFGERLAEPACRLRVAGDLPPVVGDPRLLRMVFERLITNAILFSDKPECRVEIGHREGGADDRVSPGYARFYVQDNGIGIPAKHLAGVFDMFERLHGPDAFGGGVGAGLALAQAVVARHGGTIWVESVEGRGSTFWFTLPTAATPAEPGRGAPCW